MPKFCKTEVSFKVKMKNHDGGQELTTPLLLSQHPSPTPVAKTPFLISMTSSSVNEWPLAASNARFLHKKEGICYFAYDLLSNLISIVAQDNASVIKILETIDPRDVIGAELEVVDNSTISSSPTQLLHVYSYPKSRHCCDAGRRRERHHELPVLHSTSSSARDDVDAALQGLRAVAKLPDICPKMLLVVNPLAGSGKSSQHIYETVVQPMWRQSGIQHDICITTYAGHATDLVFSHKDLTTNYNAIVAMGGDGILSEVMQGVHKRSDSQEILRQLSFAIIGTGTCNGLMKSVLHASQEAYGILEMTFLICKGKVAPMDLSTYQSSGDGTPSLSSFLSYQYALLADIDIESEVLRCIGSARVELWAVWRFLALQTYKVRLSYMPPPKTKDNMTTLEEASSPLLLSDPIPPGWEVIEDDIICVWACQTSHTAYNLFSSPLSRLDDGLFHIIFIRKSCTRYNLLKFLLRLEAGTHLDVVGVEVIPCVAFRLEPIREDNATSWRSFNDVDGEVVKDGPIQAVVNPSAMSIFANVPSSSSRSSNINVTIPSPIVNL